MDLCGRVFTRLHQPRSFPVPNRISFANCLFSTRGLLRRSLGRALLAHAGESNIRVLLGQPMETRLSPASERVRLVQIRNVCFSRRREEGSKGRGPATLGLQVPFRGVATAFAALTAMGVASPVQFLRCEKPLIDVTAHRQVSLLEGISDRWYRC